MGVERLERAGQSFALRAVWTTPTIASGRGYADVANGPAIADLSTENDDWATVIPAFSKACLNSRAADVEFASSGMSTERDVVGVERSVAYLT